MRNVRRKQVTQHRKTRGVVFLTVGILLFIYLTLNIVFGESGLIRYLELKTIHQQMLAETTVIDHQNKDIKSHIETLEKEPEQVEELAREFGFTKEGELIFKFKNKSEQ